MPEEPRKRPEKLSNMKKMQLIQEVLERDIRPLLWADGGDLELIDIDGSQGAGGISQGLCRVRLVRQHRPHGRNQAA